jgi:ubiquinone/menaquinone biosynthesis C-methylase UbiE
MRAFEGADAMTLPTPSEAKDHHEFYGTQYARFGSRLAAEVRREAYGADLGQLSWRTLDEQAEIAELIKEQSPGDVLDIACGSGGPSLALCSATGCRLTGVDIEEAAIEEAKQRSNAAHLSETSKFIVADCNERLPFDDEAFNVVVCIDAVLHLSDRFAALCDWFRLLKPGGVLLFTDAGVLTGAVSKRELDIRASHGYCVFVPPGVNEKAIAQAAFRLRRQSSATASLADIAHRLFVARETRSTALQEEEGNEWFAWRQSLLSTIENLATGDRLSRFVYVADKPR